MERTAKTSRRIQLDLLGPALEDLKWLKENLDASSYVEVTRRTNKAMRQLLTAIKSGAKIAVIHPDGKEETVLLL